MGAVPSRSTELNSSNPNPPTSEWPPEAVAATLLGIQPHSCRGRQGGAGLEFRVWHLGFGFSSTFI